MKFNRDIFLTAPLWANWATIDRCGHIWVWQFEPQLESVVTIGLTQTLLVLALWSAGHQLLDST